MEFIKLVDKDRITHITIDRVDKKNALNEVVVKELKNAFQHAEDNSSTKVIILKAEGDVFCAGADLEYLQKLQNNTYEENLEDSTNLMELFKQIYNCPKPIIAQVQGHAIAGGCGLISVCDFVFAVPEALFGYTEVRLGFVPGIVMPFLIKRVGVASARELLLSGNLIEAEEAMFFKLITHVADEDVLQDEVAEFANRLVVKNSSTSMEMTKNLFKEVESMNFNDALNHAAKSNAKARETEDFKKGVGGFLKKEKVEW